jgi:predicted transcriptional regulator
MSTSKKNPTTAELEILNILWNKEPLTVKEIHEKLCKTKDVGYTTALKIMQNMTRKGFLRREPNGKSHLYYSVYSQDETQMNLLDRLIDTAFGGSASKMVMQILGNKKASGKELDEIKYIIKQIEKEE